MGQVWCCSVVKAGFLAFFLKKNAFLYFFWKKYKKRFTVKGGFLRGSLVLGGGGSWAAFSKGLNHANLQFSSPMYF